MRTLPELLPLIVADTAAVDVPAKLATSFSVTDFLIQFLAPISILAWNSGSVSSNCFFVLWPGRG